jgi:uncharacterized protein YneF (UPF0154 family)
MKNAISMILMVLVILGFAYGMWYVGKMLSYEFMYESFVEETIREMVNKEALK